MPFLEMTQFSRIAFEVWMASEEPTKPAPEELSHKERGMRMLVGLLGRDEGKKIIDEYGGFLNLRTIRVMHDKSKPEGSQWTLDFHLIVPLKDVQRKLAEMKAEKVRLEFQVKLAEQALRDDKEKADRKKANEQKTASKKQREERLKTLGKRPFQKKTVKPAGRPQAGPPRS